MLHERGCHKHVRARKMPYLAILAMASGDGIEKGEQIVFVNTSSLPQRPAPVKHFGHRL